MPYQYGMQNSPAGGNGLGGLPKKQTMPRQVSFTRIVTAGSGVIVPPANAKYMRVAVVGGGGGGSGSGGGGGGGGGCAASKLVPAAPISYLVGLGGSGFVSLVGTNGQDSVAVFPGYRLVGGGGLRGGASGSGVALGGVGTGGDYNYSGGGGDNTNGTGGTGCGAGGGAAGPFGDGATANYTVNTNGLHATIANEGWGSPGGSSGPKNFNIPSAFGGAGTGNRGGGAYNGNTNEILITMPSSVIWGLASSDMNGGVMGGGGAQETVLGGNGGVGGIVVEWFYD